MFWEYMILVLCGLVSSEYIPFWLLKRRQSVMNLDML